MGTLLWQRAEVARREERTYDYSILCVWPERRELVGARHLAAQGEIGGDHQDEQQSPGGPGGCLLAHGEGDEVEETVGEAGPEKADHDHDPRRAAIGHRLGPSQRRAP